MPRPFSLTVCWSYYGGHTHAHAGLSVVPADAAAVTIEFKHTEPQPVSIDGYRLTYTPTNSSQALFLPTYYVYGSFVQGLDGSTGLDTDGTDGNVKNFGLYVTRKPGAPTDFTVASDQL